MHFRRASPNPPRKNSINFLHSSVGRARISQISTPSILKINFTNCHNSYIKEFNIINIPSKKYICCRRWAMRVYLYIFPFWFLVFVRCRFVAFESTSNFNNNKNNKISQQRESAPRRRTSTPPWRHRSRSNVFLRTASTLASFDRPGAIIQHYTTLRPCLFKCNYKTGRKCSQ